MLPKFFKNFEVSITGTSFRNICEEMSLPELTLKTEEWRGAGMDAPIEIDVGMEKLESTLKFPSLNKEVFLLYGLQLGGSAGIIATGALQGQAGESVPAKAVMQGGIKKIASGQWKPGDMKAAGVEVTVSLSRYILTLDSFPLATIDIENGIRNIAGIDYYQNIRATLGL
ncbi:phage major tail tube protein [Pseudobacteriovorax antillogorgiicola]|uniref:Phage major tail tube protein n=1 Tax=Pseudobacteriovorax antillogorgiicola TaxID=1513793 RepID=A0A1Y6CXU4_9BACT|nr:phage major tail tube protein [Pseudobacteriovorax antillogorgiicola]TCS51646.1 hypothetical protein EDD56_11030 [Pseudobacteriovorax antillogorgiicola]SMF84694.1 hypothetical protein SAMN06296036_1603 [Pseudobacteriovorax antillogorgiicola]